ncbi:MAG TPA: efflux RND transporter periplasmic adaptor subunit [Clostridiales bacterium]|nr:efflux RND transporter periplasmic adaptor subunit [Clostridiales bacterium]HQP69714.1 efflux RND transporter periplasmic adaptor subunit [Clostridiales bacterium]
MKGTFNRKLLLSIFIAGISALTLSCSENIDNQRHKQALAVITEKIMIEPIQEIKELSGSISPEYRFTASSKLSGKIVSIKKNIGDAVIAGDLIALLDDSEYRQDLIEAEAGLEIAKANQSDAESQLIIAKQDFETARSLKEKKFSSDLDFAKAETAYTASENRVKNAKAQVMQKEASLRSAKINLEYTRITSPKKGIIAERFTDEGNNLSQNSPVATVVGIEKVIVKTSLTEDVYPKVKIGQNAEITVDAYKGKKFTGVIKRLAPAFDEQTRTAAAEIEIQNNDRFLKPGMFCSISLIISKKVSARTIPFTALVNFKGTEGVFLTDKNNSEVIFVPVETGIRNTTKIEIVSPVIEGEVVTLGQHLLSDGSKIMTERSGSSGKKETEKSR